MTRENLISALAAAAETLGYTASFSGEIIAAAKSCGFPLLCVSPLRIVAMNGRHDCRVTYRVGAKLLVLNTMANYDAEATYQVLERDAIDLFRSIEASAQVESASGFSCKPCPQSQTPMGDAAVAVEFDVEMFYCA